MSKKFNKNLNFFKKSKKDYYINLFNKRLNQEYFFERNSLYFKDKNIFNIKSNFKKIMIVAHFDDEILFGAEELINDPEKYLVIVCTNKFWGLDEFNKNAEILGIKNLINYCNFCCDNKEVYYESEFIRDLELFLEENKNTIEKIVTHGKTGEYGNIQHVNLHDIVVDICSKINILNKVYVFNINEKYSYSENILSKKIELFSNYGFNVDEIHDAWKPGLYNTEIKKLV